MASSVESLVLDFAKVKAEVLRHYPSGSDQQRAYEALLNILAITVINIDSIAEAIDKRVV